MTTNPASVSDDASTIPGTLTFSIEALAFSPDDLDDPTVEVTAPDRGQSHVRASSAPTLVRRVPRGEGRPLPPSARLGAVIAHKYCVVGTLGEGAMGVVVEAQHLLLGSRVAIKLLRPEERSSDSLARFTREARIAANLVNDNVVRVTDAGVTDAGEPYLVMELLSGYDLAAMLAQHGPLPIDVAVDYVLQACAGLAAAHAAGLVHRDLKPANLFCAFHGERGPVIKVVDFGLSKAPTAPGESSLTLANKPFGTPSYMPPEQVLSARDVDARSDQYALGVVLFELLAGHPPFQADNVASLMASILKDTPPLLSAVRAGVPRELDAVIRRALEKHPGDRFPDLLAFAEALAPFRSPLPSRDSLYDIAAALAPRRSSSVRPPPPAAANAPPVLASEAPRAITAAWALGVAALILLAAGVIVFVLMRG